MEAAEVVHLFVAPSPALLGATPRNALPQKTLKGFARVMVKPGQRQAVELPLTSKDFQYASSGTTCTKCLAVNQQLLSIIIVMLL